MFLDVFGKYGWNGNILTKSFQVDNSNSLRYFKINFRIEDEAISLKQITLFLSTFVVIQSAKGPE